MFCFRTIYATRHVSLTRRMCTKERFVDLTVDREGIALLSLNRPPVNSLNLQMFQEISHNIDLAQKNEYKGVIFNSALPTLFSAGIDLNELHKAESGRLHTLWTTLQDITLKLYGPTTFITAFAINGHAAAGACVLSLLGDYRVMVNDKKAKIGLNDTAVGIAPRPWVCELINRVMGLRQAEIALTASTMYTAEEALKVNLIDEIASDKEDAIEKCRQFIRRYNNIPVKARVATKKYLKGSTIRLLEENRGNDKEAFVQGILDPQFQQHIAMYIEQLKRRKS